MGSLQVGQTVRLSFRQSRRVRLHPKYDFRVFAVRDSGDEGITLVEASCPGLGSIRFRWDTRQPDDVLPIQSAFINGHWYNVRYLDNGRA
jgi:hypothetical protein